MAETIKGINIVIGSDTTGLSKALSDVNKNARDIQSELKQVEKLLKLDPANTELLAQKQKLLGDAVANSREKLDRLRAVQEQVNQQFAKGEISEGQYRAFQREIVATEQQLKKLEQQGQETKRSLADLGASLQNTGDKLRGVGQTMALGVTAPVVAAGAAAVKFASDMAESTNKVNVAFGDSADKVKAWADTTLESYGIAEGSALDMAALFGDMGTAMGQSQEEAAKMSMSLVGLAGDLASFKNIGLDQAQEALKGIFTGEGEALKTLGIVMQDSTLKAYALAAGQKKAYDEMTQAEKVALRYAFVMDAAKNAQGDFARTSDGTANQLRIMQESLKELAASIGEVLLPIITPIVAKLNEWAQRFAGLDDGTKKIIIVVAAVAAAIGPLLIVIGAVISAVGTIAAALPALGTAFAALTGPVGLVVAAIAGLIAVGVLLYKNWDEIKEKLAKTWDTIKETASRVWGGIKDFFKKWGDEILLIAVGPVGWAVLLGRKIAENWDSIKQTALNIWNSIKTGIANIWTQITSATSGAVTDLYNTVKSELENVWSYIKSIPSQARQWGLDIIKKLIEGIKSLHIPKPHFSFSVGYKTVAGINLPVPNADINWYAKGGIFTSPQFVGIGDVPEAVMPLAKLPALMTDALIGAVERLGSVSGDPAINLIFPGPITIRSEDDIVQVSNRLGGLVRSAQRGAGRR